MGMGVFSDGGLKNLINEKVITSEYSIQENQIQPSSLDLRVDFDKKAFCMPYSSLPPQKDLVEFLKNNCSYEIQPSSESHFLHKGKVYVFPLIEELNLPGHLAARANPKSSTGRTDIHVRLITEQKGSFDNVPAGYKGKLWLEVIPSFFDIRIPPEYSLNQLRIFDKGIKPLSEEELLCEHREKGLLFSKNRKLSLSNIVSDQIGGRVDLGLNLRGKNFGYVTRLDTIKPVNLAQKQPASEYFKKISLVNKDRVVFQNNNFYILCSDEIIRIPEDMCAEMVDIDTGLGEFRSHYAGFFDPGFKATAVLELRNYGHPFSMTHKQKVAGFQFYRLKTPSEKIYGSEIGSHYQSQKGPKLAKFFEMKID